MFRKFVVLFHVKKTQMTVLSDGKISYMTNSTVFDRIHLCERQVNIQHTTVAQ